MKCDHSNECYKHKQEFDRKMRRRKFSGILKYKRIKKSQPEDQTL